MPYRFQVTGIESPFDLMSSKFGKYGEMNTGFTGEDVRGFSRIFGNQTAYMEAVNVNRKDKLSMIKDKAGIIGGAGYTGGELISLLLNHPSVDIVVRPQQQQCRQPVIQSPPGPDRGNRPCGLPVTLSAGNRCTLSLCRPW